MVKNCIICKHPKVMAINRDMVINAQSARVVANKYGLSYRTVARHRPHITDSLVNAAHRREVNAADKLLADTEMLWQESQGLLELSKNSVKTQAITVDVGDERRTEYREYKDLSALVAALKVAHENRRLFGDAAGVIGRPTAQTSVVLHIAVPGQVQVTDTAPPAIEATVVTKPDPDPEDK
jgi:hypothetical protein